MILRDGHDFPKDFTPVWSVAGGKALYSLGLFPGETFAVEGKKRDLRPEHEVEKILRKYLLRYDLRDAKDRAEWAALFLHLLILESDLKEAFEISDKAMRIIKELNASTDIEKIMQRLEGLRQAKEDVDMRLAVEARKQHEASANSEGLAIELIPDGEQEAE